MSDELGLMPPAPADRPSDSEALSAVRLEPTVAGELNARVARYVDALLALDPQSPAFSERLSALHAMGNAEMRESANVSNRLLDQPVRAIESGGLSKEAGVSRSLLELRRTIEDLDPSRRGLFERRRLFGLLPFGNRIRDYFARYRSAQRHLNAIINSLYRGQDELRKDNASIQQEQVNAAALRDKLERYVYMANRLDAAVAARIDEVAASDADRARRLRENVLFHVRQKRQDLVTQLAVNAQGYLALDLVRKSNLELIRGVDRATTTTLSALRTAIIVAQALTSQRLVLDQVSALNATTANLVESTAESLRTQTGEVHEQAASAALDLEKLQAAFASVYAAIDGVDRYKLQALDSMERTVKALTDEVARAQAYLEKAGSASPSGRSDDDLLVGP